MPKGVYQRTAAHRANISRAAKKRMRSPLSDAHKIKIGAAHKGHAVSSATRTKIRMARERRVAAGWTNPLKARPSFPIVGEPTLDWFSLWDTVQRIRERRRKWNAGYVRRRKLTGWRKRPSPEGLRRRKKAYYVRHCDEIREKVSRWFKENRERANVSSQAWAEKNPEKRKSISAKYYKDHTEACLTRARQWQSDNRDKVHAAIQTRKERDPEKYRLQHIAYESARRARGGSKRFTVEEIEILWLTQEGVCVYCPSPLSNTFHIDHRIPLSKGGTNETDNLQLTCRKCNLQKHTKSDEEFRTLRTAK